MECHILLRPSVKLVLGYQSIVDCTFSIFAMIAVGEYSICSSKSVISMSCRPDASSADFATSEIDTMCPDPILKMESSAELLTANLSTASIQSSTKSRSRITEPFLISMLLFSLIWDNT